jgi:RNA polymerase subunit RPABC4/transcription elongation factor Spt4
MIFCEQCGNKLNEGAKFCGKCGAAVSAEQEIVEQSETMSASTACTQCGTQLEEGEMFCPNCGMKVGAVPTTLIQNASAPTQSQATNAVPQFMRKWVCTICGYAYTGNETPAACPRCKAPASKFREVLKEGAFFLYGEQGDSLLYRDKLIWNGSVSFVIPIKKISSVRLLPAGGFRITLDDKNKYDFLSTNELEVKSWCDTINSLRNGTL